MILVVVSTCYLVATDVCSYCDCILGFMVFQNSPWLQPLYIMLLPQTIHHPVWVTTLAKMPFMIALRTMNPVSIMYSLPLFHLSLPPVPKVIPHPAFSGKTCWNGLQETSPFSKLHLEGHLIMAQCGYAAASQCMHTPKIAPFHLIPPPAANPSSITVQ